jgi:hypothetical protein
MEVRMSFAEKTVLGSSIDPAEVANVVDGKLPVLSTPDTSVNQPVTFGDSASLDAFARLRVSEPFTVFDSKQIFDNQPLLWDDQETSGGGTGSSHSVNEAATTISVSATTAGTRARQTFMRFNYQPGKSQQILLTWSELDTATGITKRVGYFDDENGLFFESAAGTVNVCRRSYVTGAAVDTTVAQASWNLDTMDGAGVSGITLDFTKSQIGIIDFEWLGVGRVRFGFVIDGIPVYCHELLNANNLDVVYMSTPNLPIRYEIDNDGTGASDEFIHICCSVQSEGGQQDNGKLMYKSTAGTHLNADSANTLYAVIGIRLKSAYIGVSVDQLSMSMISETNDDFEWVQLLNPTVAGTFTYTDLANSACQYALGVTANTVSGGTELMGGFSKSQSPANTALENAIRIGSAIDGTQDTMVLCVRPLGANEDIQASLTWRELS